MNWAKENPRPVEAQATLLRRLWGLLGLDQDRFYGAFDAAEQRCTPSTCWASGSSEPRRNLLHTFTEV